MYDSEHVNKSHQKRNIDYTPERATVVGKVENGKISWLPNNVNQAKQHNHLNAGKNMSMRFDNNHAIEHQKNNTPRA